MRPEPENNQPGIDATKLTDTTVREIVHLSVGGPQLRLKLANTFGAHPLTFDSVHIARPVSPAQAAIDPATDRPVTFSRQTSVVIPPGATYLSDPIVLSVPALADLTVSFHLAATPDIQSLHPGSRATSYLLHGLHTADADLPGAEKIEHWYQLAEVDVAVPAPSRAILCLGDSITDGHAATTNGNDRWTDQLARRLAASPKLRDRSVLNEGIGGNHLLTDGLGQNALGRFERDVLGPEGAAYLVVFEGINDIGGLARRKNGTPADHAQLIAAMEAAYGQLIERGHAHGMKVYGVTITPFVGSDYYAPTPADEADRLAVNVWIRQPPHFDGIIDFDEVVRDPQHPDRLLPAFDSGDHLHPGPAGYKAMGDEVPLDLFR